MKPVELDPEAAEELRQTISYLENKRTGCGDEFAAQVEDALNMIGKQPRAFSPHGTRFRKFVLRKFGYLIFYVELDDRVWVAAIASGRREPDYWIDRQPQEP